MVKPNSYAVNDSSNDDAIDTTNVESHLIFIAHLNSQMGPLIHVMLRSDPLNLL